jgi:hypothetical protein
LGHSLRQIADFEVRAGNRRYFPVCPVSTGEKTVEIKRLAESFYRSVLTAGDEYEIGTITKPIAANFLRGPIAASRPWAV